MKTEATRNFKFGFVLTEAELRRLVVLSEDQLRKLPGEAQLVATFEMKFRNGALAKTQSLEEVLAQENHRSSRITELRYKCTNETEGTISSVLLQFADPDFASNADIKPINYAVSGDARDWVFVTSSLIEERILKIRRLPFRKYLGLESDSWTNVYMLSALVGLVLGLTTFIVRDTARMDAFSTIQPPPAEQPKLRPLSERYEDELRSKSVKDPIEALLVMQRVREKVDEEQQAQFEKRVAERERLPSSRSSRPSIFWTIGLLWSNPSGQPPSGKRVLDDLCSNI